MNAFAEIRFIRSEFSPVFGGACHIGLYVYQRTDKMAKFFVEIDLKLILLFIERAEVVFIIFKERSVVVGRFYGIPVQMPPVPVV